ncbi:MAG: glycosyltransferase family 4 protein, partial [Deltaproteobacteria bacterium]|nr:glycosyltransferase family 4 protein [Deltaproteobacteria bacterium]
MKILLVAPEICSPWTEGRKRFVRDLGFALSKEHDVILLCTKAKGQTTDFPVPYKSAERGWGPFHLIFLHNAIGPLINNFKPHLVCHFPYATFQHIYRLANTWTMWKIDRLCRRHSVPCFTIMYSISKEATPEMLKPWVSNLVLNQFSFGYEKQVRLGICFDNKTPVLERRKPIPRNPKLLFMAGMWQQTHKRLKYVLERRGLSTLLRAGKKLTETGAQLIVAVPLLENPELRDLLLRDSNNTWSKECIKLIGEVPLPDIFESVDLFVFPYAREESSFLPTSVIESMAWGTPVILPDHDFLAYLRQDGRTAFSFPAGNSDQLANIITDLLNDPDKYNTVRENGMHYVRKEMSIEQSCKDLL